MVLLEAVEGNGGVVVGSVVVVFETIIRAVGTARAVQYGRPRNENNDVCARSRFEELDGDGLVTEYAAGNVDTASSTVLQDPLTARFDTIWYVKKTRYTSATGTLHNHVSDYRQTENRGAFC